MVEAPLAIAGGALTFCGNGEIWSGIFASQISRPWLVCFASLNMAPPFESLTRAKQFTRSFPRTEMAPDGAHVCTRGNGEIRTLDEISPMLVFETSAFNHSATFPYSLRSRKCGFVGSLKTCLMTSLFGVSADRRKYEAVHIF